MLPICGEPTGVLDDCKMLLEEEPPCDCESGCACSAVLVSACAFCA